MKIIRKGNIYKRAGWFKEHEEEIYIAGCVVLFFCASVLAILICIKK